MKAWIISNPWDDEGRQALTFADTRNEAKSHAGWFDNEYDWIGLRAIRAKTFDDMENLSEKELMRKLFKHKWDFPVDIYGTITCERCGIELKDYWSKKFHSQDFNRSDLDESENVFEEE